MKVNCSKTDIWLKNINIRRLTFDLSIFQPSMMISMHHPCPFRWLSSQVIEPLCVIGLCIPIVWSFVYQLKYKLKINNLEGVRLTWTLASLRSSLKASSSLVNTSGYWVFSKVCSSWWSWYVVKVVLLRRIFLGLPSFSSMLSQSLLPLSSPTLNSSSR